MRTNIIDYYLLTTKNLYMYTFRYMLLPEIYLKKKTLEITRRDHYNKSITSFLVLTTTGEVERALCTFCFSGTSRRLPFWLASSTSIGLLIGKDPNICTIKLPPTIKCSQVSLVHFFFCFENEFGTLALYQFWFSFCLSFFII